MSYVRRLFFLALCFAALTSFVDSTSAAAFKRVHEGDAAPVFALADVDGNEVTLDDYREGPLTVVTFWALWSPKSLPLLQDVQKLLDEFGDKGLRAVAVNVEGQNAPADLNDQVRAWAQKNGFTWPMLVDKELEQYEVWGVIAIPATAFLGKDLQVVYEFSGRPTSAYVDMRQQVMKTLGIEEELAATKKPKRERYQASKRVMLNYGLAKTLFGRGQFSKAGRKLKKVLKEDPQFPEAQALNGAIQLGLARGGKAGKEQAAREAFEKSIELDDTVPLGLAGTAHFALADGDVPKALELARRAVEFTEPEDMPSLGPKTAAEGEAEESKPGGKEDSSGATAEKSEEGEIDGEAAGAAIDEQLTQAAAALEAGNSDEAKSLTEQIVEGLLNIAEGPKMKGKGLMMMKKNGE